MEYKLSNVIRGGLIYATGDTVAALLSDGFSWPRVAGILLVGCTVYAFEIPNYFRWIDRQMRRPEGLRAALWRTLLAMLYFNPVWIARHLLFLYLCTARFDAIGWSLLAVGTKSFLVNIPVSLAANYTIQNKIPLRWRFVASAVFSALMAVYYALSAIWFD